MFHRIKDLREDADLTQAELAGYLHIFQRAYSHYENGTRDIPTEMLIQIADFYRVSIDYLLERTENKNINQSKLLSLYRLFMRFSSVRQSCQVIHDIFNI